MDVHIYYGDTGSGKTRAVYDKESLDDLYVHPGGHWFDGYDGQDAVLFDDFSGSCFPISYFLKILDRYPMTVPVKGGFVNWKPRRIYVTSNLNPTEWYSGAHIEHQRALRRRFTHVIHFSNLMRDRPIDLENQENISPSPEI